MKGKTHLKILLGFVSVFSFAVILVTPSYAELPVESYFEVVVEIGREGVEYLGQVDALTQKYCEDPNFFAAYCAEPNLFLAEKAVLEEESSKMIAAVLAAHETTALQCLAFLAENQEAIKEYQDSDPNVKEARESISREIDKLSNKLKVPSY